MYDFKLLHRGLGLILLMGLGIPDGATLDLVRYHPDALGWSVYDVAALAEFHGGIARGHTLALVEWLYATLCIALIVGWNVRGIAIALLCLHYRVFVAAPLFSYGFDYIVLSALTYCAFYSARWAPLVRRTLQVHLCIIYFFSGLNKAVGPTWHNGEAVWKAVQQSFGPQVIPLAGMDSLPWLWMMAGWGVVLLEFSYPFLIWSRHLRPWLLAGALLLHFSIALFMGLYAFSALMILLNLVAVYSSYKRHQPDSTDEAVETGDGAAHHTDTPASEPSSHFAGDLRPEPP